MINVTFELSYQILNKEISKKDGENEYENYYIIVEKIKMVKVISYSVQDQGSRHSFISTRTFWISKPKQTNNERTNKLQIYK